ncbi:putative conserved membrane protein [Mycobacterium ulcerans str. Harvey]|uniref:Conserved membrane protein n=1 Tax=Mycobacterium ulcerans str. Harvey TaxID=1299332 RepID=A0ABP3ABL3_MYCUL|nr:putative conserved membrane protein [Mycobacterium ulcerans str. Harvey]
MRRGWSAMPLALRLLLPIAFVLISAGIGVAFWLQSPPDNWARLPNHLECRIQEGHSRRTRSSWPRCRSNIPARAYSSW